MSAALRAATKFTSEVENPEGDQEKLSPHMLASAIKLAALSVDTQEKLTPATVDTAMKVATHTADGKKKHEDVTPESLAAALKLVVKTTPQGGNNEDHLSTDQMLAAMKAAVAMTQAHESVSSETLADALKLAKN